MRNAAVLAILLSLLFAAVGSAQTVFAPVQSQYRTERGTYYYGGSDPRAHQYAAQKLDCHFTGRSMTTFSSSWGYLLCGVVTPPRDYVISDRAIYLNASLYGYTQLDARNEANARVPTFFRMGDLLQSAVPSPDGSGYVVPAQAPGTIDIRAVRSPRVAPASRPATNPAEPKAILIIPKKTQPREL